MGFLKKGSMKSAAAGGLSSLLLCYVYTQLPTNPTFASSLGLGTNLYHLFGLILNLNMAQ